MIVPVLFSLHLLRERNRNIVQLKAREEKLLDLSRRFDLAMETANIGIWEISDTEDACPGTPGRRRCRMARTEGQQAS